MSFSLIPNIPKTLSNASDGFKQQTFLGASIRDFSINAGYGDTTSTLSINLVNDEYNKSDQTNRGEGDDVYHNGQQDEFKPPQTGSPVFFKFGKTFASVQEAYTKVFDDIYNYTIAQEQNVKGGFHLTFGGILQSYVQNRSGEGNPLFSVQVVDPREILANTTLILNNYAGTTFNNANMYNIYGFLEYNRSQALVEQMESYYVQKNIFRKIVNPDGTYYFTGDDMYTSFQGLTPQFVQTINPQIGTFPIAFPVTGTGFSRRSSQGIPFYRLRQGLNSLLGIYGEMPEEYKNAGFGGFINFRGFNYIVDLSGLANISDYYFLDFDQINLLDLCLEVCDISSTSLFVSLLPIINHPACAYFYNWNNQQIQNNNLQNVIAGIIRVDSIDRSFQPEYGAIKTYIDNLANNNVYVTNQDIGFELSNVTTDKFIVGAQEVDMYYFSNNADRDELEVRKQKAGIPNTSSALIADQWRLETSLKQQILPYYGLLGNKAVTIPKGFGAYQQIMLDTTGLNADGVGNYYVATELELRASLISYDTWKEFLFMYNDIYLESMEDNDAIEGQALDNTFIPEGLKDIPALSNSYAVSVPRSVFTTDKPGYGSDGLPLSPCNPPYGYPLYYKRATKIGIPEAGATSLTASNTKLLTNIAALNSADDAKFRELINSQWKDFFHIKVEEGKKVVIPNPSKLSAAERQYFQLIANFINDADATKQDVVGLLEKVDKSLSKMIKVTGILQKKTIENSRRVYAFIKKIAEECLGRKFLVKIPREVNLFYNKEVLLKNTGGIEQSNIVSEIIAGPFGFRPRSINKTPGYEFLTDFQEKLELEQTALSQRFSNQHIFHGFLTRLEPNPKIFKGALEANYNPLIDNFEFNYQPDRQGGYIEFDLFANTLRQNNLAISQALMPQDVDNFIQDNNRLSAYVRFDNSQDLSLDLLSADSFTQQVVTASQMIPDLSQSLDNIKPENNEFESFTAQENNNQNGNETNKQIAFVKCDVDEKFYMPPRSSVISVGVHGTKVKDIGGVSLPKTITACDGTEKTSIPYYQSNFVPDVNGISYTANVVSGFFSEELQDNVNVLVPVPVGVDVNANILDFYRNSDGIFVTDLQYLDTDHVYALITLPSRVMPTKDARYRDATFQEHNTAMFKHFMCMDVVKIPEFNVPAFYSEPQNLLQKYKSVIDPSVAIQAAAAAKKAIEATHNFALPNRIQRASPSPIYPDLVALPLLSKERCYGPWVSSQIDIQAAVYENIGGRIEFVKDENLAPWNFNGYDLMNQAGILQAEFSNSLLLQSERGGFVVPDAPSGVALGKFLANSGPLVTNINVDIGDGGVQTTYKLDLYTASFGKLQKQKQDAIANISRERQKLKDERNALVRKGIGKNQKNANFNIIYDQLKNMNLINGEDIKESQPSPGDSAAVKTGTVKKQRQANAVAEDSDKDLSQTTNIVSNEYTISASYLSDKELESMYNQFTDRLSATIAHFNTASSEVADESSPLSLEPGHPNMPFIENVADNSALYNDGITDITTYS
jgi:hypothetical protein